MNNINYKQKVSQLKTIVSPSINDAVNLMIPLHLYYKNMAQEVKIILEEKYDLSKSELDLLVDLATTEDNSGTLTPTKLYELLLFSSAGMTKLLQKLELKSYITRLDNPKDKRSKLVQITSTGKDIATKAINDVMSLEAQYFSGLSDIEKSALSSAFEKLAFNIKD